MNLPIYYQIPYWANALLFVAVLLLSLETSYRVGKWQQCRTGEEREVNRRGDVILSALLALLGLMLAFTYSFTNSRSDMRNRAAVDEINSIGTAFLRADLLDEPHRILVRTSLLDYARTLVIDPQDAVTERGSRRSLSACPPNSLRYGQRLKRWRQSKHQAP